MINADIQTEEIRDKLLRTIEYVRDCSTRVGNGEIMDLTGLDKTVSKMCKDIESLPKEQANEFKDNMSKLVSTLDDLAENIEKHKEG